jgi:hypothetical protein
MNYLQKNLAFPVSEAEGGPIPGKFRHWIDFLHQAVPEESRNPTIICPIRRRPAGLRLGRGQRAI